MFPEEFTGRFLRIGPNPIGIPGPHRFHWFTGTGTAHGGRLRGGCVEWYRNRIARSADAAAALVCFSIEAGPRHERYQGLDSPM